VTRVVTLVPRRDDGGWRDRLWAFCRARWEAEHPDFAIFEGHHNHGPFNRSAAINRAAADAGDWDVALIIDADIIPNAEAVERIVDVARTTGRMAVSHTRRVMLGRKMTEAILDGYTGNWERGHPLAYTDSCSCCIAVPHTLWDAIGGFDEQFVGWGYEDSAFGAYAKAKGGPIHYETSTLYHLWHEESPEAIESSPLRHANEMRLRQIHAALRNEIAAAAAAARPVDGDVTTVTTIPRILHRTVPADTSPEVEGWWETFRALHPDWEHRTYREPVDPAEFPISSPVWGRCQNGAQKAGLIRLELLVTHGGVYVDSDVQPFKPLDPLLALEAFCGWEDERVIPDAVLGARPHHPAFEAMLDDAVDLVRRGEDAWHTGPGVTTRHLGAGRWDVLCLPPGSLYDVHYHEMSRIDDPPAPWTFVRHRWHASWLTPAQKAVNKARQR
jgi:mannosyltransferase OCH1-like enzyme